MGAAHDGAVGQLCFFRIMGGWSRYPILRGCPRS
jgi:hypothetical protein